MKIPTGVIIRKSPHSVKETIDRLIAILRGKGATIFARINQQTVLAGVGIKVPPLEFVMFGNPRLGAVLMIENPQVALDLPLKVIAWADRDGIVYVSYNEQAYIEQRYGLSHRPDSPLEINALIDTVLKSGNE